MKHMYRGILVRVLAVDVRRVVCRLVIVLGESRTFPRGVSPGLAVVSEAGREYLRQYFT